MEFIFNFIYTMSFITIFHMINERLSVNSANILKEKPIDSETLDDYTAFV